MMVYHCDEFLPLRYTNSEFQSNKDSHKSTSRFVFTLGGEVVSWRNMKQSYIINFTMEVEYVVVSKVAKEVIWLQKFLIGLRVVPLVISSLVLFFDNNKARTQPKESRNHRKGKHIEKKYHLICEIAMRGDMGVGKFNFEKNLIDLFMKTLSTKASYGHKDNLVVKCVSNML